MSGIEVPGIGKHRQTCPPKHCGSLKTGFCLRPRQHTARERTSSPPGKAKTCPTPQQNGMITPVCSHLLRVFLSRKG